MKWGSPSWEEHLWNKNTPGIPVLIDSSVCCRHNVSRDTRVGFQLSLLRRYKIWMYILQHESLGTCDHKF